MDFTGTREARKDKICLHYVCVVLGHTTTVVASGNDEAMKRPEESIELIFGEDSSSFDFGLPLLIGEAIVSQVSFSGGERRGDIIVILRKEGEDV